MAETESNSSSSAGGVDIIKLLVDKRAIEDRIDEAYRKGYKPSLAAFDGMRIQCRDSDDKSNWLVSQNAYERAVASGYGDVKQAEFRTLENATVTITFSEAVTVLHGLTDWGFQIMRRGWALKDALRKGETYDLEQGWPE